MGMTAIDPDTLTRLIQQEVKLRIQQAVDEVEEEMQRLLAEKINQQVDLIAIKIMSHYSVQSMGSEILIRVSKEL